MKVPKRAASSAVGLLMVGVTSMLVSGCGSPSTAPVPATTAPGPTLAPLGAVVNDATGEAAAVKATFVTEATSICAQINAEYRARPEPKRVFGTEAADFIEAGAQDLTSLSTKLKALPQPPAEAAALAEIYVSLDQVIAAEHAWASAARSGGMAESAAGNKAFVAAKKLAVEKLLALGLVECTKF